MEVIYNLVTLDGPNWSTLRKETWTLTQKEKDTNLYMKMYFPSYEIFNQVRPRKSKFRDRVPLIST